MKNFLFILISVFVIIAAIAVTLFGFILIGILMDTFVLPKDYLFYEHTPLYANFHAYIIVVPIVIGGSFCLFYLKKKLIGTSDDPVGLVDIAKKLGKWNIAIVTVWIVIGYVCFTNLTYVTPDKIVKITPFDLKGEEYSYTDVEKIEAGFGDKKRSFFEYEKKGSFYYKIYIDGDMTVFHMPVTNSNIERYDDTYLELEEFDAAFVALDIPKKASSKGYENCYFDTCYVERFLRIIGEE